MLELGAISSAVENFYRPPDPVELDDQSPRVLTVISSALEKLVARNDRLIGNRAEFVMGKSLSVFHGVRAPTITIHKYLERIYKYTNCSASCFVVGYVYIDRLAHKHPYSLVVSYNIHRLIVTSVMVASKILDDIHYNNAFYAKVGGVTNSELNKMELELLSLLDFGVSVRYGIFESYCEYLEKEMLLNNLDKVTIEQNDNDTHKPLSGQMLS